MRERSNRAVSKTVEPHGSGGSNPPLSEKGIRNEMSAEQVRGKAARTAATANVGGL